MRSLQDAMRPGAKLLLLAFDRSYTETGDVASDRSSFYVPNAYARAVAQRHPDRFEWAASIHPFQAMAARRLCLRSGCMVGISGYDPERNTAKNSRPARSTTRGTFKCHASQPCWRQLGLARPMSCKGAGAKPDPAVSCVGHLRSLD
jgi:hypothetical protein